MTAPMTGLDLLGLAHPKWDTKGLAGLIPVGSAIGVFDDPFGPVIAKLKTLLSTGRFPAVRIHAHWSNSHAIIPLTKLKEKLPRYEKLAREFPEIKVYVSHSCEHNEKDKDKVKQRIFLIEDLAPSCIPVNSVWRGAKVKGCITEHHGDTDVAPGEIVSTDGINSYDIDADNYNKLNQDALITFHWGARFNLREIPDPGESVPPPAARTAVPSKEYIKSVVALLEPKGAAPDLEIEAPVRPIKKPLLYKTHAEDSQGISEARENRPCLILNQKAPIAQIMTCKGQPLGALKYFGVFQPGLHRYYSGLSGGIGLYGYEIAERAKKVSGSPWVWFECGGKVFGPVHPAFRHGYFR